MHSFLKQYQYFGPKIVPTSYYIWKFSLSRGYYKLMFAKNTCEKI